MSNRPTSNAIEIRLTPSQKAHYFRRTGMFLHSISLPLAQLKRLSGLAAKAGTASLPISRSAVRQVLGPEPSGERGEGEPFVVELALTARQKEQIRRVTGDVFVSLRIGPHDFPVTYHETWDEATPIRIGRTMAIKPAGKPYETPHGTRIIELPAGDGSGRGVFGTGRHPTTQLSLVLLEEYVGSGDRVLDLGTGSGILAVAAARMGAGEVLALDTESAAVAMAHETVALNGLAGVVEVGQGSIESARPPYDVVAANIFPNVLIEVAPKLAAIVRRGGVLVTSGSVVARAEEAAEAVCSAGFGLEERRSQGNWVGMVFRKP